jgi:cytochrome b
VKQRIRVWDLPVRLFHWALAVCIILGIIFVKIGGNAIEWHAYCGYTALVLVLFRIIWGFVGSWHARFTNFIPSAQSLFAYLKGQSNGGIGHNPLGAFSVIALLLAILVQALTGLFADDDIFFQGPLAKYISNANVALLTSVHRFNQYIIFALITLHLVAIFFYQLYKKERLIEPMITGDKQIEGVNTVSESIDTGKQRLLALIIFLLVGVGLYYLIR